MWSAHSVCHRARKTFVHFALQNPTNLQLPQALISALYSAILALLDIVRYCSHFCLFLLHLLLSATILLSFVSCIYSFGNCSYCILLSSLSILFINNFFQFIMVNHCVVGGCSSDPRTFNFPKDHSRRRVWVNYVCLTRKYFSSSFHSMPRLCRRHVSDQQFRNKMQFEAGLAERWVNLWRNVSYFML